MKKVEVTKLSIKNGIKRYSEKGLEELKTEYPEFLYNK